MDKGKQPAEKKKKPVEKEEKPAVKAPVPGANYPTVEKGSRRSKKKNATNDKSTEAGPSSTLTLLSPAQTEHGQSLSLQNLPPTSGESQIAASPGNRQPSQISSQPTQSTSYLAKPFETLGPTSTSPARQSSSQPSQVTVPSKSIEKPNATGQIPRGNSSSFSSSKDTVSTGSRLDSNYPSKGESSEFSDSTQVIERLKGQPPRPPSKGMNTICLMSNYFKLTPTRKLMLWHYDIIVKPEVKGSKLAHIIKIALKCNPLKDLKAQIATDFSAVMFSTKEIPEECRNFKLSYFSEIETQASENAKEYQMSLAEIGNVDLSNFNTYISAIENGLNGPPIEQVLDIILGHHRKFSDNIAIINRRKTFMLDPRATGFEKYDFENSALVALRGYFSSVRMSQSNFLVNINVSHGVFYGAGRPLVEVIRYLGRQGVHQSKISGLLRGLRVSSSHVPSVWSIWGYPRKGDGKGYMLHPPKFTVDAQSYTPDQVFFFQEDKPEGSSASKTHTLNESDQEKARLGVLAAHGEHCNCRGEWRSVADYFRRVRRDPMSPQNISLPLVNVGSNKRPTYLPSHLCQIRPGQVSKLKLDPQQIRDMTKFAVRAPDDNAKSIKRDGFETLGLNRKNPQLASFGIEVDNDMVPVMGRKLNPPTLLYFGGKNAALGGSKWSLLHQSFRTPKTLTKWACVKLYYPGSEKFEPINDQPWSNRLGKFVAGLKRKGIEVEESDSHGDCKLRSNDYRDLEQWFKDSHEHYKTDFMLVLLPQHPTAELYNSIKRFGDLKYKMHTVCVKPDKFGTNPQYNENVALKVNLKLGGTNHILDLKSYGLIGEGKICSTMVVGIDVTHPAPGVDDTPSVAAMVASYNKDLSNWPADLRINNRRQEMVETLRDMLRTRLRCFEEKNRGQLPTNILIYRDGVGEGQYKTVLDEELPRLRNACKDIYQKEYVEGKRPRISLIVVGKRHHTRFYRTSPDGPILSGKSSMASHGTVVDTGITQNCNWDFYLQSHTAFSGTPRPAHYFVLLDEIFRQRSDNPQDELERLTYNLCYLYGKATTSVSIPPPVYYADKACDRGRRYLSKVFDPSQRNIGHVDDSDVKICDKLKDSMFYI